MNFYLFTCNYLFISHVAVNRYHSRHQHHHNYHRNQHHYNNSHYSKMQGKRGGGDGSSIVFIYLTIMID